MVAKKDRMERMHPEVLNVDGAAEVLGVSRWLVLKMARRGELPGKKVGKEWRFRLSRILRWLAETEGGKKPATMEEFLKDPRVELLPRGKG